MQRQINLSKLCTVCVIAFFIICIPVWIFRANTLKTKATPKINASFSNISVSVYNITSQEIIKMDIEEYLFGVVAAEMPASFESEALKAQAIAARTYTTKKLIQFGGSGCSRGGDICTDFAHCQAYINQADSAKNWGAKAKSNSEKIQKAVLETLGQVITYEDKPIEAFFHSTSGGMTENSENAFSQALPYLVSVESDETNAPKYSAKFTISKKEFVNTINKEFSDAKLKVSTLQNNIKILTRFDSGRANTIKLGNSKVSAKQIRSLFTLNSTNLEFSFNENSVIISTKGYGHGVGMSQTGANNMAKSGAKYLEILSHYYSGTEIQNVW